MPEQKLPEDIRSDRNGRVTWYPWAPQMSQKALIGTYLTQTPKYFIFLFNSLENLNISSRVYLQKLKPVENFEWNIV